MIIDMPNIQFTNEEWIYILKQYLNGWTEIPLNEGSGYNLGELKFYDGFIGYLIKQTEQRLEEYTDYLSKSDREFINSWKYQGKLYRIIHANRVENSRTKCGYSYKLPKVNYHGMITHWTDDYTFKGLMYKLSPETKYIILEADTQNHIGFDVNKFRKKYSCEKPNTEKEREIIFPMYKECIKEHRISVNDFIQQKQSESHYMSSIFVKKS